MQAYATARDFSPVKSASYLRSLGRVATVRPRDARHFLAQWHGFSKAVPALLCLCAYKAPAKERSGIVKNLASELGLDADGVAHPELLADLIRELTGDVPDASAVTPETRSFIDRLFVAVESRSPAFSAGLIEGLEEVAYDILDVLKEVCIKSGRPDLVGHPYITIHELVEQQHIECTTSAVAALDADGQVAAAQGRSYCLELWNEFWDSAYRIIGGGSDVR